MTLVFWDTLTFCDVTGTVQGAEPEQKNLLLNIKREYINVHNTFVSGFLFPIPAAMTQNENSKCLGVLNCQEKQPQDKIKTRRRRIQGTYQTSSLGFQRPEQVCTKTNIRPNEKTETESSPRLRCVCVNPQTPPGCRTRESFSPYETKLEDQGGGGRSLNTHQTWALLDG